MIRTERGGGARKKEKKEGREGEREEYQRSKERQRNGDEMSAPASIQMPMCLHSTPQGIGWTTRCTRKNATDNTMPPGDPRFSFFFVCLRPKLTVPTTILPISGTTPPFPPPPTSNPLASPADADVEVDVNGFTNKVFPDFSNVPRIDALSTPLWLPVALPSPAIGPGVSRDDDGDDDDGVDDAGGGAACVSAEEEGDNEEADESTYIPFPNDHCVFGFVTDTDDDPP